MSWRQLGVGLAVIVLVVGLLGLRALQSGNSGAEPTASALSSLAAVASASAAALITSAPSVSVSAEPTPTASPTPSPTPGPTAKPTVRPTAVPPPPAPTPIPQPTDYCPYIEGTGGMSYLQPTVVAGQTMEFYILQPVQQTRIHLEVDYPDGQTISLGDKWLTPQPDGSTKVDWVWTVPASMTPGTGTARSSGGCGVFSYDQTFNFTITAP